MISPGPERVASYFTEDTIFKGPHPYSVGRQGIADYYGSQPLGMTATYKILETGALAGPPTRGGLGRDVGGQHGVDRAAMAEHVAHPAPFR